jgi:hypothetical protein
MNVSDDAVLYGSVAAVVICIVIFVFVAIKVVNLMNESNSED